MHWKRSWRGLGVSAKERMARGQGTGEGVGFTVPVRVGLMPVKVLTWEIPGCQLPLFPS